MTTRTIPTTVLIMCCCLIQQGIREETEWHSSAHFLPKGLPHLTPVTGDMCWLWGSVIIRLDNLLLFVLVFIFFRLLSFLSFSHTSLSTFWSWALSENIVCEGSGLFIRSQGTIIITGTVHWRAKTSWMSCLLPGSADCTEAGRLSARTSEIALEDDM